MISTDEFTQRRQRLMDQMEDGDIAILPAATEKLRNGDVYYSYRQNSDFYYLTGFPEPEAVAVIMPGQTDSYILFNRPRDIEKEIWNGKRSGQAGACTEFAADKSFAITDLDKQIPQLLPKCKRIFYAFGVNDEFDQRMLIWLSDSRKKVRAGINEPQAIVNIEPLIHEMRLCKTDAEISLLRSVAEISAQAHLQAMRICKAGMYEYQLAAELLYEFQRHGCQTVAYDSIVAGGDNACILHYTQNDKLLEDGDLVLIDAGGELQHYAADITRTFPVNGRFSKEQKAIYELVLAAQLSGIEKVKSGVIWTEVQAIMVSVITHGLCELGILQGDPQKLIMEKACFPFYMHNSGHWLGMDVHDSGSYKVSGEWRPLEAGMVLTVEPGIYIAADNQNVEPRWRGIGVRIEDDILVTENGAEVLSAAAPKTVADIESIMSGTN